MRTDNGNAPYERSGAGLLIEQAPFSDTDAKPPQRNDVQDWNRTRTHLESRLSMMRSWRFSWIQHWALIAQYVNPRRSLWLAEGGVDQPVPNSMVRGLPINQAIMDPTATYALQVCAAGMFSGLMSPSRPWFRFKPRLKGFKPDRAAQLWFEAVEDIIYAVMAQSNFYDSAAQMIEDLVSYGTAPMIIYEDDEDIIRCYNPIAGEYFIAVSNAFRPETLYRLFVMTVSQIVEMFTLEACPGDVQSLWATKGSALETEFVVAHAIEPNFPIQQEGDQEPFGFVRGDFDYREHFWLWGKGSDVPLSKRGFKDQPFIAPRWWVSGNDPYGRSPAMNALGDIAQLQQETRRKAELLEKIVRPPMNAPVELKNQPSSIAPGGITYTSNPKDGMSPVFQINPQGLPGITADLQEIQQRIKNGGFFNDLFLMLADIPKQMTAYEVAQRMQERLQVLGPVIERFQNEAAAPAITRVYSILARKKLLPPMPKSLAGQPIEIEFISMLAMAQRAVRTAGIEQLLVMQGKMAATDPSVLDLTDNDAILREYADNLGVSMKSFKPEKQVEAIRQARAKAMAQQQQQAAMQNAATQIAPAVTQAAQNLGSINTGGGSNALSLLLGGSSGQPPQGNA